MEKLAKLLVLAVTFGCLGLTSCDSLGGNKNNGNGNSNSTQQPPSPQPPPAPVATTTTKLDSAFNYMLRESKKWAADTSSNHLMAWADSSQFEKDSAGNRLVTIDYTYDSVHGAIVNGVRTDSCHSGQYKVRIELATYDDTRDDKIPFKKGEYVVWGGTPCHQVIWSHSTSKDDVLATFEKILNYKVLDSFRVNYRVTVH